jgi:hypothetical protein
MPVICKLTKPLSTHKGEVTELELRDLTAKDMVEARVSPQSLSYTSLGKGTNEMRETRIEIRYDIAMSLAVRLTGVDEILLGAMCAKDFDTLVGKVLEVWNSQSGE